MSDEHISPAQQVEIAKRLIPHHFDSPDAIKHFNALSEPLGVKFGHESISHEVLSKHLKDLADAGHFHHHEVEGAIRDITGIDTPDIRR